MTTVASLKVKVSTTTTTTIARKDKELPCEDLYFIKGKVSDIVASFTNIDVSSSSTKE